MNKALLLLMLLFSVTLAYSQVKNSRTPGQYSTSFQAKKITAKSSQKSAKVNSAKFVLPAKGTVKLAPNLSVRDTVKTVYLEKKLTGKLKSAQQLPATEQAFAFLDGVKKELKMNDKFQSFELKTAKDDELGQRHIRMGQKYKGIQVYNSDFYLHFSNEKEMMHGKISQINSELNVVPKISKTDALGIVQKDLSTHTQVTQLPESVKKLMNYSEPMVDTVIVEDLKNIRKFSLAYHITIRPNVIEEWKYFVNAENGAIIKKINNTKMDGPFTATAVDLNGIQQTINTYLESGKYYLMDIAETMFNPAKPEGFIATFDAKNSNTSDFSYSQITSADNTWSDKTSVSAHVNAIQVYRYFKNTFGRNSINGAGGNIISFINVADEDGSSLANAFWNGEFAFYGNGGNEFKPLAGAFDVAAHELGHGVIGSTANLEYEGQAGAINEAFADIFGAMAERKNWFIGEDVTQPTYIPSGRLRDMSNPHNGGTKLGDRGWQPKHMSEMYTGTQDNGGVHVNSGVCNYAFYLFATSTSKEVAEKVFYRSLTNYLNRFSQFIDLRIAVIQSATDLYGATSTEVAKAKEAFNSVGIHEEQIVDTPDNYSENPGTKHLLFYDTDTNDEVTLYKSSAEGVDFVPLTTTPMDGKTSVTDDGSYAVFVSDDNKIRSLTLDANPVEEVISPDEFWENVAISRDGKRIAAVTTYVDTSIYVYDFDAGTWAQFYLYSPTSQEDVKLDNVLYADAIQFDHTGEYLIFDAFNSIVSLTGDSLNYWDIGLMHVWDKNQNTFADGSVVKLYGSLPENVSIGNPVFSKNSPLIIAFDYWDEGTESYSILGLNIETMDLKEITSNTTLGFPDYSVSDDKIAYNAQDTEGNDVVAQIALNPDKISAAGSPSILVNLAMWPVYYATGTRVLGFAPTADFTASYKTGKAPLAVNFSDLSENNPTAWEWTFQSGTPASSTEQNPLVTYNSPGTFSVTLKATNQFGNNSITKSGYIVVTSTTDITDVEESLIIYPNPVKNTLYVESRLPENAINISIWSLEGKMLKQVKSQKSIYMGELTSGLYIVKVEASGFQRQLKIVKE